MVRHRRMNDAHAYSREGSTNKGGGNTTWRGESKKGLTHCRLKAMATERKVYRLVKNRINQAVAPHAAPGVATKVNIIYAAALMASTVLTAAVKRKLTRSTKLLSYNRIKAMIKHTRTPPAIPAELIHRFKIENIRFA